MSGKMTVGRRVYAQGDEVPALEMGEYTFAAGRWWARPPEPGMGMGNLGAHDVTEHEDGTITVSPSILINMRPPRSWHGYLERGVWREV